MNKEQKDYLDLLILILVVAFFLSMCSCKSIQVYFYSYETEERKEDSMHPWYLNDTSFGKLYRNEDAGFVLDSSYYNPDLDKNKSK